MWRKYRIALTRRFRQFGLEHQLFSALQFVVACFIGWWFWRVPIPGLAVATLAVVAAMMSVHGGMRGWQKFLWMMLIGGLLVVESRAIRKDRGESQAQAVAERASQDASFNAIRTQEKVGFGNTVDGLRNSINASNTLMQNNAQQFSRTMQRFSEINSKEQRRFDALIAEDEKLFRHQEQLAESFSGTLIPASLPMPANPCVKPDQKLPAGTMLVIIGSNASIFNHYPHTVLEVNREPMLQIKEAAPGVLFPVVDVRGPDGKIVARFDKDGYLVGGHLNVARPDRSTLDVTDQYGNKALYIHYINQNTIEISGYVNYRGALVPIERRQMSHSCSGFGVVDVSVALGS